MRRASSNCLSRSDAMPTTLSPSEGMAKVYETMGRIIGQWQHVDDALFSIFFWLTDSKNQYSASITYYSIHSVPLRTKIIDALLKTRFTTGKRQPMPRRLQTCRNL